MRIFVTGATGFVGKALIDSLLADKHTVIAAVRKLTKQLPTSVTQVVIGDLSEFAEANDNEFETKLATFLSVSDVFVHLAGRAHITSDDPTNDQSLFNAVNASATFKLAKLASKYNVRRFLFLSSIGVNGNQTSQTPFTEQDNPNPQEPYAVSKWRAEQLITNHRFSNQMEWVIIRPPLVYGPEVPGNFASLIKWTKRGVPLPFGAVHNKRSIIALDNLTEFITLCLDAPAAGNQTFVIADDESVSMSELIKKVAAAQGMSAKLFPVPVWLMKNTAKLLGKSPLAVRLFGDLRVDNSKAHSLLGWKPVTTMDQQLKKTMNIDPQQFK
ncbi:NAD-dependent epimerase/dehydratase family protein [Methylophaga nitratireducenticrescens]|uniref:NAD-dependent epimerase/dehydratase family protein n=1 Tax=Methylophaga nitratireducenticrescens TaxID=754476 RepID=UPI000CDBD752|nr:NAD-dependent epimerase/dehydratase family protein [Methylophaga nitratireducenticrescens]AUZ84057.1 epimerase [Methylophaga nitratireducenticrescens]